MAGALRDPDRDDIGAGSHGGEVATEDGAQQPGPTTALRSWCG